MPNAVVGAVDLELKRQNFIQFQLKRVVKN